jgi:hypothetical protein
VGKANLKATLREVGAMVDGKWIVVFVCCVSENTCVDDSCTEECSY